MSVPYIEVLDALLTDADKSRLAGWEQFKSVSKEGHVTYSKGQRKYQRRLGTAGAADYDPPRYMADFTGVKRERDVVSARGRRSVPSASRTWISKAST